MHHILSLSALPHCIVTYLNIISLKSNVSELGCLFLNSIEYCGHEGRTNRGIELKDKMDCSYVIIQNSVDEYRQK